MNMTKKIVFGAAAIAVSALLMAPSASAACNPGKSATTFSAVTAYWIPVQAGGTLVGQAWQLGAPASFSSAGCPQFLSETGGGISLALDLGACGTGCTAPLATLATLAQSQGPAGTSFLLDTIVETPASSVNFDYSTQGNHNMIPIPRPRVLSSARVATNLNLSVALDSIAGGLYGPNAASAVNGFRILTASSATDPGRDASAYSAVPAAVVSSPGGAATTQAVVLNCTNPQDQWLVTQIQFENGLVLSGAVSGATRVHCDPTIANPKPKVKIAPKATPRSSSN